MLKKIIAKITGKKGGAILAYHRIFKPVSDPQLLCVTPKHFSEQVEYLKENFNVLSLPQMVSLTQAGKLPEKAIVITFDDGYIDNLENLKPILEKHNVPATVFVSTGYIGKGCEYWWDELEQLILLNDKIRGKVKLEISGISHEWELGGEVGTAQYSWNVLTGTNPTPRQYAYQELHKLLKPVHFAEREKILESIAEQSGRERNCRESYRAMNKDEVLQLIEGGLVTVGAHTVTHPLLSAFPYEVQRKEIIESKQALEEIIKKPVLTFSYPYGGADAINEDSIKITSDSGFICGCANFPQRVVSSDNLFKLPRFLIRDWDKSEFAKNIQFFFSA